MACVPQAEYDCQEKFSELCLSQTLFSRWDCDQQAAGYAKGLLMPSPKVVFVPRFKVPTESMLRGGPEHKIQHGFTADRVRCRTVFRRMNPRRTNAHHELRFFRERPRLLEQKVDIPFSRMSGEKRCDSRLNFQPVLYRLNFNRDGRAKARSAVCNTPVSSSPKLRNGSRLLVVRLREGVSKGETQTRYQHRSGHVQNHPRSSTTATVSYLAFVGRLFRGGFSGGFTMSTSAITSLNGRGMCGIGFEFVIRLGLSSGLLIRFYLWQFAR